MSARLSCAVAGATFFLVGAAGAATFDVVDAVTLVPLGSIVAPAAGGPVTSGSLAVEGGVYDVLGMGSQAPVLDLSDRDFNDGAIFLNSATFPAMTVSGPVTCEPGDCLLQFFEIIDPTVAPEYVALFAPPAMPEDISVIDTGFYAIEGGLLGPPDEAIPPVPLPASALLLGVGIAALVSRRRRAA